MGKGVGGGGWGVGGFPTVQTDRECRVYGPLAREKFRICPKAKKSGVKEVRKFILRSLYNQFKKITAGKRVYIIDYFYIFSTVILCAFYHVCC
jgi:hypothetical protein